MNNIKTCNLTESIDMHFLKSEKFKTNRISLFIYMPLSRENATKAALLPMVLKRGCVKYPTMTEFAKRAEALYGASVGGDIRKHGDGEFIQFTADFISDKFLPESITDDVLELLRQFAFCPVLENDAFKREYVKQEKENLKKLIQSIVNDKREYAQAECEKAMFEGDPYGVFEYGYIEDLDKIDEKNLYEFYKKAITDYRIDFFLSGNFGDDVFELVKEKFTDCIKPRQAPEIKSNIAKRHTEVKNITEEMNVVQSKLCMGITCDTKPYGEEQYALAVMSCVYGGSPFSKLFNNVREKLSLAYYVSSRVIKIKGYMMISAGIETEKYQAAYDEIMLQLDYMKNGKFTDNEIQAAKKYMITGMSSVKDSLSSLESYYMGSIADGETLSVDEFIEKVEKVEREEIVAAANRLKLDTVYFLKGKAAE